MPRNHQIIVVARNGIQFLGRFMWLSLESMCKMYRINDQSATLVLSLVVSSRSALPRAKLV